MNSQFKVVSLFVLIAVNVLGINACSDDSLKPIIPSWQEVVREDIKQDYKGFAIQLSAYAALEGDAQGLFGLCKSSLSSETPANWNQYAEAWCLSAAEKSYPDSANFLAEQYSQGLFGEEKTSEADKWFDRAVQHKKAEEDKKLRSEYFEELWGGFWIEQDGEKPVRREKESYLPALSKITKLAEEGDTEAMIFLAARYYNGQGVRQSNDSYFEWISRAAENGSGTAANMLGRWYLGDTDNRDRQKALHWFERSIQSGLGRYDQMHTNPVRFVRQLRAEDEWKAANKLSDETIVSLLKKVGTDGELKDKELICDVAKQLNESPHRDFYYCNTAPVHSPIASLRFIRSDALYMIKVFARRSFYGDEIANQWLEVVTDRVVSSALDGNPDYADALIFECNGEFACIKEWEEVAIAGFEKRAEEGDRRAMYRLAAIFSGRYISQHVGNRIITIPPERVDKIRSKKWLEQAVDGYLDAAKEGEFEALFGVGYLYEKGIGLEKDRKKAQDWFSKFLNSKSSERYNYFHLSGGHSSIFDELRKACHLENENIDMFPVMTGNKRFSDLNKLECPQTQREFE